MKLSRFEANDIANFLWIGNQKPTSDDRSVDEQLVEQGRKRFFDLRCNQCHTQIELPRDKQRRAELPSFSKLRPDHGCLSNTDGTWPKYVFDDSQLSRIRSALTPTDPLTDEQDIQVSLTTFRCANCHQRGELGGVSDDRNHLFQTTNPNLGPQGRIPPDLTGVGAKLQAKWMRQVMVSGKSSRPYVKTRMPQHGADNIGHLIELFQKVDKLPKATLPEIKGREPQKKYRDAGFEMAGTTGLNCIACHTFQEKPAATMPAIELTEMSERLKPDWFYHYMLNPQRFNRGTVMPSFWPGGRSIRKEILDGEPNHQIAGLWEWLSDGRQARTPRGLIREPIELLATNEAVMLRRSWHGIGKRGIGVGYPGQVNLAFDAEQMRIAILWRGKFADPAGVWRSQGHGVAHPLSREQTKFLPGPELDDANSPWVADEGRPPKHKFKGYVLDELRRPTFLYEFDGIAVEDYSVDTRHQSGNFFIRRTLTFQSNASRANLMFRIATNDNVAKAGDDFQIGNSLTLKIKDPFTGEVTKTKTGNEVRIPFDLKPAATQLVLEYRWK